jgi:hypothetical protein
MIIAYEIYIVGQRVWKKYYSSNSGHMEFDVYHAVMQ